MHASLSDIVADAAANSIEARATRVKVDVVEEGGEISLAVADNGKGTMGWCHGFRLHVLCNDSGEVMMSCLTRASVDDRDERVWTVFARHLYGKVFADKGCMSSNASTTCSKTRQTSCIPDTGLSIISS